MRQLSNFAGVEKSRARGRQTHGDAERHTHLHRVRLPCPCLSVREYGRLKAGHDVLDDGPEGRVEHLGLGAEACEDVIDCRSQQQNQQTLRGRDTRIGEEGEHVTVVVLPELIASMTR